MVSLWPKWPIFQHNFTFFQFTLIFEIKIGLEPFFKCLIFGHLDHCVILDNFLGNNNVTRREKETKQDHPPFSSKGLGVQIVTCVLMYNSSIFISIIGVTGGPISTMKWSKSWLSTFSDFLWGNSLVFLGHCFLQHQIAFKVDQMELFFTFKL